MSQSLSSLDGFDLDELSEEVQGSDGERVLLLSPEQCYTDKQVRTIFDDNDIEELAESLKNTWQQQAIVVYPADQNGLYKIDKGERRWRAAKLIEGFKLKAIVDQDAPHRDRTHQLLGQLTENDRRVDLPIIDMANALNELIELGLTRVDIAHRMGWITESKKPNKSKVSRILSVLKLPETGRALVENQVVSDLITIELMSRLHSANEGKFEEVCESTLSNDGITRKEVEAMLKEAKGTVKEPPGQNTSNNMSQENNSTPSNDKGVSYPEGHVKTHEKEELNSDEESSQAITQEPESDETEDPVQSVKSESESSVNARVQVECLDGRKGFLVLNKKPEDTEAAFVSFKDQGMELIRFDELMIHSLEFN